MPNLETLGLGGIAGLLIWLLWKFLIMHEKSDVRHSESEEKTREVINNQTAVLKGVKYSLRENTEVLKNINGFYKKNRKKK